MLYSLLNKEQKLLADCINTVSDSLSYEEIAKMIATKTGDDIKTWEDKIEVIFTPAHPQHLDEDEVDAIIDALREINDIYGMSDKQSLEDSIQRLKRELGSLRYTLDNDGVLHVTLPPNIDIKDILQIQVEWGAFNKIYA